MLRSYLFFASTTALILGCSSSPDDTATTTTSSGATTTTTGATTTASTGSGNGGSSTTSTSTSSSSTGGGPATTQISTSIGPITAQPGEEDVRCITVSLHNADPVLVRRFSTTLQLGSHHMILYLAPAGSTEDLNPTPCQSFQGILQGQHPIFIAEQANTVLPFPTADDGTPVALALEANQMLRIELHYINTNPNDAEMVGGQIDLDVLQDSSQPVTKSDLAFWGTQDIHIPAHSAGDTGLHFQQALPGTKSFAVTSHQHHFGTEMRIWYAADSTDQSDLVVDSHDWSNPVLALPSPSLDWPAEGGKGFLYECNWNNTSDQEVDFGESAATNEMCFLWHYYYPAQGFQICFDGLCYTH